MEPSQAQVQRGAWRGVARKAAWPLRRMLDRRFAGLAAQVESEAHDTRNHLGMLIGDYRTELAQTQAEMKTTLEELRNLSVAEMNAAVEAATLVGEGLADLAADIERLRSGNVADWLELSSIDQLPADAAAFLNQANSHRGLAAERNLWFNWPLTLEYEAGNVRIANINERIVEVAYALRALAPLTPGARILDVGATESTLALSLAALGFSVTALDPRPYPMAHPNLEIAAATVDDWQGSRGFAGVVAISTLEHIGTGEYGQAAVESGDAAALARLRELTSEGGLLVLTTPYGSHDGGTGARSYDRARLEELLSDWEVEDLTIAARLDETTWTPFEGPGEPNAEAVALVTARRPS
jgi:Methyltransferase domain